MTRTTPKPLAGVVLCGGESTRMGREKALIPVNGRPLVLHVAGLLARACDPVFLAPGRPGRLGPLGYPELEDAAPGAGPLGGVVAGLAASPHELVAAVAVDMPFASPAVLTLLSQLHRAEDAVVPRTSAGPQPLHAVYGLSGLSRLRSALVEGRLALRAALSDVRVRWVDVEEWSAADSSGRFALNLNRQDDLVRLRDIPG
jgi:molybdopterin-guanine dinucleotide biosynthesis protein A